MPIKDVLFRNPALPTVQGSQRAASLNDAVLALLPAKITIILLLSNTLNNAVTSRGVQAK